MWYGVTTIILYSVGAAAWLFYALALWIESCRKPKVWKRWRASVPIGLVSIWLWPIIIPVVIIWYLWKFTKDAFDIIRERNN